MPTNLSLVCHLSSCFFNFFVVWGGRGWTVCSDDKSIICLNGTVVQQDVECAAWSPQERQLFHKRGRRVCFAGFEGQDKGLSLLFFSRRPFHVTLDLINSEICLRRFYSNSTPLTHYGSHHRLTLQYQVVFTCSLTFSV